MGWAARAKVAQGNPTVDVSKKVRFVNAKLHQDFFKSPHLGYPKAQFSDRTYVVDEHGTLRRIALHRDNPDA